jgi:ferric-dicitrate binding protein FerR (iron transport regulator)
VTSGKGQIKEVYLADGTHVWLNAESTLEFPNSFSSAERIVRLEGEAYFEVKSDPDHPFYVHSGNHQVQVTGTHFNIKKYPEDHKIETVLKEGKVRIIGENVFKDLLPGQRSSFDTKNLEVVIDPVDVDIYTSWHEGRYEFKNAPFGKVMKIVERWWDVEVVYDEKKLKDFTFSGVLKRHKDVDYIFEIIKQFKPISYQTGQNKIIVTLK